MNKDNKTLSAPFWIVWAIEFWERFGFYGFQAIIALYFTNKIGLTETQTIYIMGSFFAFTYGFVWIGGYLGDKVLGAKRSVILGSVILAASYCSFSFADKETIYYTLAGIIIGNAIFKANPSSLISKMFEKGDSRLDGAMTLYYMAINVGSLFSMSITPIIAEIWGYKYAFIVCGIGLIVGVIGFFYFYQKMQALYTNAGSKPLNKTKFVYTLAGALISLLIIANILPNTKLCVSLTAIVVIIATTYFLYIAFSSGSYERNRMLVALVLIVQAIIFFALYFQMPTTLTFFAVHNVQLNILGWDVPAAQYQVLNPFWIVVLSPILAILYKKNNSSHASKFCFGMVMMFSSYAILYSTKFFAIEGLVSGNWLIISYAASSLGELLISGLGLAMVAELCPAAFSGFVMGFWFISSMIASYLASYVGSFIALPEGVTLTTQESLETYTHVFGVIALALIIITILMIIMIPTLNKYIKGIHTIEDHKMENV
ncbi:MFS transporter [Allofrancisella guangzhouensis]|uniref:Major facilitator transporter n=1 Tax=Allofrancisella guangzhouensis TaxID=594679 RepID=A0A0A8E5I5_9GAMM|nr:oligopeptide:H+ symporter [Allofrancisella guangzhouensis]AJC48862.1 major facilitator transporter [Allofrancisella guangzhouensis]MBK2027234.1 MFS transporter [Allofrancisella guangzhouensis]MBK2043626.1 MFS transporter [Allofrancisella guangzhouensis]MBK2045970.1 MFS transporter [Allofrancisella guangzhouensis]